jgi:hypothetical protein
MNIIAATGGEGARQAPVVIVAVGRGILNCRLEDEAASASD